MWYLPRLVTAIEWEKLANVCTPQRAAQGIYAFCFPAADGLMELRLNKAAPGEWSRVA